MPHSKTRPSKARSGRKPQSGPEDAAPLFCRNCGAPSSDLESYCPSCGTLAGPGEEE